MPYKIQLTDIYSPEGLSLLKDEAYDLIENADHPAAAHLARELEYALPQLSPQSEEERTSLDVAAYWLVRLKVFSFSALTNEERLHIFSKDISLIIKNGLNLPASILSDVALATTSDSGNILKGYANALRGNNSIFSKNVPNVATIGEWIQEYQKFLNGKSVRVLDPTSADVITFINTSPLAKQLAIEERGYLRELLSLYNFLISSPIVISSRQALSSPSSRGPFVAVQPVQTFRAIPSSASEKPSVSPQTKVYSGASIIQEKGRSIPGVAVRPAPFDEPPHRVLPPPPRPPAQTVVPPRPAAPPRPAVKPATGDQQLAPGISRPTINPTQPAPKVEAKPIVVPPRPEAVDGRRETGDGLAIGDKRPAMTGTSKPPLPPPAASQQSPMENLYRSTLQELAKMRSHETPAPAPAKPPLSPSTPGERANVIRQNIPSGTPALIDKPAPPPPPGPAGFVRPPFDSKPFSVNEALIHAGLKDEPGHGEIVPGEDKSQDPDVEKKLQDLRGKLNE